MRAYFVVTAVLFTIVALIHLVRAISGWGFTIGAYELPLTVSWIGFAATAALAGWSFSLLRQA